MVFIRRFYYSNYLFAANYFNTEARLDKNSYTLTNVMLKMSSERPTMPRRSEDIIVEAWYYDLAHEVAEKR